MPVRRFDGTDDQIATAIGGCDVGSSAYSIAFLARPLAAEEATLIQLRNSAAEEQVESGYESSRTPYLWTPAGSSAGSGTPSLNVWGIFAVTKASGTVKPRFHYKAYPAGSWSHVEGASTITNAASLAGGSILLGGGYQWAQKDYAAAAVWKANLSDANVEALASTYLSEWLTVTTAPAGLWLFNQASVETAITDLTGNGASQTARTGTTVQGEEPPIAYEPAATTRRRLTLLGVGT